MRKLKADEIECRVATVSEKGCSLLLYKTARVDRAILDETYGQLWQNDFKVIDGKMYGGIGIYNKELKEWLWRWDCGTESNQDAEKGQASDCFKRAGFKWGIGVELYSAPFIFVKVPTYLDEANSKGYKKVYKLVDKYAKFEVKSIDYADNGEINKLVIYDNEGKQVYKLGQINKKTTSNIGNDDADIYVALAKIDDIKAIKSFYETNKGNVNDAKAFNDMANARIRAIKEIKAKFEDLITTEVF